MVLVGSLLKTLESNSSLILRSIPRPSLMDLLTNLYPSSQQRMICCENHVVAVQKTTLNFIKKTKKHFKMPKFTYIFKCV